jgi:hypothetical protein
MGCPQLGEDQVGFDLEVRPGDRTESAWEVKVRRPTEAQLQALVKKARLHPPTK